MVTLETTLRKIHDWSLDRMHTILDECTKDEFMDVVDDAHAIHEEFAEWLDPNAKDHDVLSLEYIGDEDGGII